MCPNRTRDVILIHYLTRSKEILLLILVTVIFALFPLVTESGYLLKMVIRIFIWGTLTQCWNILSGYTGYSNAGIAAFYGLGAYLLGIGLVYYNVPLIIISFVVVIVSASLGLMVGGVSLRLKGPYFTITTLMMVLILGNIFYNLSSFIPGATSEIWIHSIFLGISGVALTKYYYLIFYLVFTSITIGVFLIDKSRLGYGLKAIGEDEVTAEELGVNVTKIKIVAFLLGSIVSGLVGFLHAIYLTYVDVPLFFSTLLTFLVMYVAMLGGRGIWYGPLIGTLLYVPVDEAITLLTNIPEYSRILYGLLFVLIMLFMPEGVGGFIKRTLPRRGRSV